MTDQAQIEELRDAFSADALWIQYKCKNENILKKWEKALHHVLSFANVVVDKFWEAGTTKLDITKCFLLDILQLYEFI